jgi:hypothetical protein
VSVLEQPPLPIPTTYMSHSSSSSSDMTFSFGGDDGGKGREHFRIRARAVPQSKSNTSPRDRYVSSHFNTHPYALCTPHPRLISLIISLVFTHSYY